MGRAFPGIVGLAMLALPMVAHANAGIGFFAIAIPFVALAFIPATLLEAPILARLLRTPFGRALGWSFLANLVSTVLGAILGLVADVAVLGSMGSSGSTVNRGSVLASLLPMFFLSWWLEYRVVVAVRPKGGSGSPFTATLTANAASYVLLAAAVAWVPSTSLDFPRAEAPWRIHEIVTLAGASRTEVAEHYATRRAFPEPRTIPIASKHVHSLVIERGGRIVAQIHYPGTEEVHGKHVVWEPVVESGELVRWHCGSPDMSARAERFLPAACRAAPPASGAGPLGGTIPKSPDTVVSPK